ncbi:MAG: TAT-dependent nitrous-oxide reductase, partial [Paraburkholderia sp.]
MSEIVMTNAKGKTEETVVPGRRRFLASSAVAGLAGASLSLGLAGCNKGSSDAAPAAGAASAASGADPQASINWEKYEVHPGKLDTYYGFSSGGHSGDLRIHGLPSGREIRRVPIFNVDCMSDWGITNESRAIIGTKPNGQLNYTTGDTHHVHLSYTDGVYDGKHLFVNDKLNGRIARVKLDTMECDAITQLPNVQGFHGIFPDKRDPVDDKINYTTRVFCGNEFHIPQPNDGRDVNDPSKYFCLFTCVDAVTMQPRWQVKIDGNMDLVATSYDGKLACSNQYNTENGVHYEEMMAAERDSCIFFNVARIEEAVKAGKVTHLSNSKVPIVDGTKAGNTDPKTALVVYVPVPKNPHGVNISPDGKYYACSGKLSPTATLIQHDLVLKWF